MEGFLEGEVIDLGPGKWNVHASKDEDDKKQSMMYVQRPKK